jgi:hypothetical protein
MCCQGTQECTCAYYTCRCVCCAECIWRRNQRESASGQTPQQQQAAPSSCLVSLAGLVLVVLLIVFVTLRRYTAGTADLSQSSNVTRRQMLEFARRHRLGPGLAGPRSRL